MPKETWIIGSLLTVALLLALLTINSCERKQEVQQAQSQAQQLQDQLDKSQAETAALRDQLAQNQTHLDQLQKEKEAAAQGRQSLEEEMRSALQSKDVMISRLQGQLTVTILDRILFDSGEAELKPDGEAVLRKVADFLAHHPQVKVQVIGHTDNVPIRASARNRFPSNWELSTARATAAVRFLTEQAGVDPRRLGAVGYGEFRPVADNATAEGRAKNRRIEITLLPDELASPSVPPGNTIEQTNAAPALPNSTGTNKPAAVRSDTENGS